MRTSLFTAMLLCMLASFSAIGAELDSIGLERKNGNIFILHRIEYGETLYAISKRYNVDTKVITDTNPNIVFTNLQIGQIIRIPHQIGTRSVASGAIINNNGIAMEYNPNATIPSPPPVVTGKQQIGYMVRMGDSLYGIAKKFNTDIYTLKTLNKLTSNDLQPGQVLLVEIEGPALQAGESNPYNNSTAVADNRTVAKEEVPSWVYDTAVDENSEKVHLVHTVEPGNTIASIADAYKISETRLRELNKMNPNDPLPAVGNNVVIGISYIPKSGGSSYKAPSTNTSVRTPNPVYNDNFIGSSNTNSVVNTGLPTNRRVAGIGAKITGNSTIASNKALALHATAHEGTYIKVTNPNNGKYTLVKVVGRLSAADAGNSTVIKLSQAACQTLGITDDRFQIILEYND